MISIARSFGAPVIDPPGNAARSRCSASMPGLELSDDGRDEVMHGGVVLEREQLGDAHGARRAHARQIVAHQVHDHQVLGAVLGALGQRLAERGVVLGTDAARARALDRPRLHEAVAVHAKEALRRRADHVHVGRLEERRKRRGVARPEPRVERPRRLAAATPRNVARGSPGRCRRRRCTRARAGRRRDSPRA